MKLIIGSTDLATTHPNLVAEWHPTLNGELTPQQVTAGSPRKIWWLGVCKHEWDASLSNRSQGKGCPVCRGLKIIVGINDLGTTHPDLAREWHPTKNGNLTPQQVIAGTAKKYWWVGACNHEWITSLNNRSKGTGCPFCSKQKVLSGFNDLGTTHPDLAREWHPTKNGSLTPEEVIAGTAKKYWWQCKEGHEWQASSNDRSSKNRGCQVCAGYKVFVGFNDLATTHPLVAAEWHPTRNGNLEPKQVVARASIKIWWLGSCRHEWESMLYSRVAGYGCPVCSGKEILIGYNDLATINPVLAAEWHPTLNGDLTSQQVTVSSGRKVWWLGSCNHEWETAIYHRIHKGCPVCSGKKILMGYNDLTYTCPDLAAEWHPTKNGSLTPEQVSAGSAKKVWWLGECSHEWEAIISDRTGKNRNGCPFCSGNKILIGFNDLATTHPLIAAEWHPTLNGDLTSQQVSGGSSRKVWWLGSCSHEWEARINSRGISACGECANHVSKAEKQIKEFLERKGFVVEQSNRTILQGKEIDIWLPEHKVGIEFNGIYWHSEKYKEKDFHYNKWRTCKKQDIQLIQIWEDDWNLRHEIIKRTLAHILGVATTGSVALDTQVISITEQQAEEFLTENHLQGFASGLHYLGLVETGDIEKLQAVMVLEDEPNSEGKSLEITRYASIANVDSDFSSLLSCAITAYSPESISAIADHCEAEEEFYATNGFIVEKELLPEYMYVIRTERKPRSEYPLERFHDDPKLLWKEGRTEMELADLNGLNRIWDAGKTIYRLVL